MADVITTSTRLEVEMGFADGDNRSFNLPNPLTDITSEQINGLSDWMLANQPLVGDETGADFVAITDARYVQTLTKKYDLGDLVNAFKARLKPQQIELF